MGSAVSEIGAEAEPCSGGPRRHDPAASGARVRAIAAAATLPIALSLVLALPAHAASAASAAGPIHLLGIPVDFILFGADPARRGAVPPPHAAGGADRPRRHRRLQARLHRLQIRGGPRRSGAAHAARVGDPRQPVPPADGLRPAVAALRDQQAPRRDAGVPARRLEGRLRPARHRVRAVELPRQHRRGADRRGDGARGVQGPGAHRLSRRHRRRVQRRRLGQRGGRHHHHHDVDRRRQPAGRGRGLCRGGRGAVRVRHTGGHAAAEVLADHEGHAARHPRGLVAGGDRLHDPDRGHPRQRRRQPAVPRAAGPSSRHRRRRVGGAAGDRPVAAARTGASCRRPSRARSSCWRSSPAPR